MTAAQQPPSGMLLYACALALCFVYIVDTIIVAYNYRFYPGQNPPSSKLLFLAEALKLLMASCFYLLEKRRSPKESYRPVGAYDSAGNCYKQQEPVNWWLGLPMHRQCQTLQLPHDWRSDLKAGAKAMLVFSVPAVCYFLTNNLSFQALKIMSAHTYTLLSDLKVITTCVLSYLVLDKHLNRQAITSLAVLFAGICLGQYATSSPEVTVNSTVINANWVHGVAIMSFVAILSAVAAVYTEWMMNYSSVYGQESLNLQNMRLYASGTLLNGLFCVLHSKTSLTSFNDMRLLHWVNVAGLAFMGLVTALIIKRFGNIVKVYASCVASLFAAGVSYALLHDAPAPLFYVGCILSMVATLQLQQARSAATAAAHGEKHGSSQGMRYCMGFVVLLIGVLLIAQGLSASKDLSTAHSAVTELAASTLGVAKVRRQSQFKPVGPTTDAAMSVLPPFEPTCIATELLYMERWGCAVLECSRDPSCTVHNISCCTYLNYQMLSFLDDFLVSRCLQDEYFVVFGTALGAIRDQSIFPHTEDLDVGMTPMALQYLELNATREELWRHGYAVWHHTEGGPEKSKHELEGWWKVCPHRHHPSPHFQAAMLPGDNNMTPKRKPNLVVYADLWPVWPVDETVSDCTVRSKQLDMPAILATPWDGHALGAAGPEINPCTLRPQRSSTMRSSASTSSISGDERRRWCIHYGRKPFHSSAGSRMAHIGDRWFPAPGDQEEFLTAVYGPTWRVPEQKNHGKWPKTPDSIAVVNALREKLAVGAWGDMPYAQRKQRCDKQNRTSFWG